jgi:hypothetical protein
MTAQTGTYVDVDRIFWALCERVCAFGGSGPWGILADSMRIVLAAFDGEEWALEELRTNRAWQLNENGDLP